MVYPHLTYGITLWGSTYQNLLNKLKVLQKRIIRAICRAEYLAHIESLFTDVKILMFEDIYRLSTTKFVLSYMKKDLPMPLGNMYIMMHDAQIQS